MKDVKILVATHKKYFFPPDGDLYFPIMVGVDEGNKNYGYLADNTGSNISFKHRYYSDLSSIYWGWKNLDNDYLGFCHYRRYFISSKRKGSLNKKFRYIIDRKEISDLLEEADVVVPTKRKYFIETIESHYSHSHNGKDLEIAKKVVEEISPDYYPFFIKVLKSRSAHIFNIFIMKKDKLDSYCNFVFPILFELENRVNFDSYDLYESRVCGYIAEFLLDTWIYKNKIKYVENRICFIEKQKWVRKIFIFLRNKFFRRKRVFCEYE